MRTYGETQPGGNYADTSFREDNAWTLLCRGFGTSRPKTDYRDDRLEFKFLLRLCGQYQRTDKTKRKLIQQLRTIDKTLMNAPFAEAAAMIEATPSSHDEAEAQMGRGRVATAVTVNTIMGTGMAKPCRICSAPGHAVRDCMVFMKRTGTCGHWFMHSIGKYQTGCRYGDNCKLAHKRPEVEPEEDTQQVKVAATTGAALEEQDEAAASADAAKQAQAETEDGDAEEAEDPTELPTAERAVMALGARPSRWSQVATREQRRGNVQVFMASAKAAHIEDGDLYDTDGEDRGYEQCIRDR